MNEIQILEKAKELLWDGEGDYVDRPKLFQEKGSSEYICHCLHSVISVDITAYPAYCDVKERLLGYLGTWAYYCSTLVVHGVIANSEVFGPKMQHHRHMLVDQLINYYKEHGCGN